MPLVSKRDFVGLEGIAHLGCGGQPPLLKSHQNAFNEYAADKASGMDGYNRHWQIGLSVKEKLAGMTGLSAGDFALIGNASEGIIRALSSIDWRVGDNAVVSSLDYASGRYALMSLRRMGVEVRLVETRGWWIDTDSLLTACDEKTRAVYVSQVNAHTGQHIDLKSMSESLKARQTALIVDASHALGVVPVDGRVCDFLVCSTYKFLLAAHSGILAWNRQRWPSFEPSAVGWNSADPDPSTAGYRLPPDARRAEIGNSNHLSVYLLNTSLDYLNAISAVQLSSHINELTLKLSDGLTEAGCDVITSRTEIDRGPNVSFLHSNPERFVQEAAQQGILLWGDAGRVRASVHAFVGEDDLEALIAFAADQNSGAKLT